MSTRATPAPSVASRPRAVWVILVLAAVAALAYSNSWRHQFVFDDLDAITSSPNVRHLWPPSVSCGAPAGSGASGRPLTAFTLALNYAIGGMDPRGYRAFNVALHAIAAALAFLLLRATLRAPPLRSRYGDASGPLAAAIALLWLLHPVHTAAIDHVVYRNEILAGIFLLLALLAVRRRSEDGRWWTAVAVAACLAGTASKETMVAAPLLVLLYDRLFLAGSWRAALGTRGGLYAGLALSWVLLAVLVERGDRGESVGFGFQDVTPLAYARTSLGVVVHYLRLVFWPDPLVLDYMWPVAGSFAAVAPQALLLALLGAATVVGMIRGRPASFVGALFFAWLAPTSSFIPLTGAIAAEHRMYVPSLAPIVLAVLGAAALARRVHLPAARYVGSVALIGLALGLGFLTLRRNRDFDTELSIWADTVAKRPGNPRAENNLGSALVQAGRVEESLAHFETAIRLAPRFAPAHRNLGSALARLGRNREAIAPIREALHLDPNDGLTHYKLGQALQVSGDRAGAIASYESALRLSPNLVMAHQNLGIAHMQGNEYGAARQEFQAALALDPDHVGSLNNLAWLLATCPDSTVRDGAAAVRCAERAARLTRGDDPEVMDTLAAAYAEAGRFDAAVETLTRLRARVAGDPSAPHAKLDKRLQLYSAGRPYRMGS